MHALKCCINEASLCFCHGAEFIRLFSEDQSSKLPSTEKTKNEEVTFSKNKRPSSTVTVVLQIKKLCRVDICDRNTSSIACNEHIQTVMGQQKCKTSRHWPNVEPMLWAKDGPMSKRLVGPFNIYNHGPIVRRPMGQ